jgi:hypothetical protein
VGGEFVRLVFSLQIVGCAVEMQIVEEGLPSCAFYGNLRCGQVSCLMLPPPPRLLLDAFTHACFVSYSVDQVASAGIATFLLFATSRCPASFCPCGVLLFVLDGMAAEVSFELPQ